MEGHLKYKSPKNVSLYTSIIFAALLSFLGCAKDGGSPGNILTYSVLVETSGLTGEYYEKAVLINNGSDVLEIGADGEYHFPTQLRTGDAYDVQFYEPLTVKTCDLENNQGVIGEESPKIELSCTERSWHHPVDLSDNISPSGYDTESPDVALNDGGNGIVVWSEEDGSHKWHIYKSEYRNNEWHNPEGNFDFISPEDTDAFYPQVAMDNNGNAVIVWVQADESESEYEIFMSEYRNGVWSHPDNLGDHISPGNGNAFIEYARVAMDDNGNTIIAYSYMANNGNYEIFKSEYRNGHWDHPQDWSDFISPSENNDTYVDVAMSNSGEAAISWANADSNVLVSLYNGTAWTHPASSSDSINPPAGNTLNPRISMNNTGDILIAWWGNYIFKSERINGVWSNPIDANDFISHPDSFAMVPIPSIADNGDALIVWAQTTPLTFALYKSEKRQGVWSNPESQIDFFSPGYTSPSGWDSTIDSNGNAIISWIQGDNSMLEVDRVYLSEYRNGTWIHPDHLGDSINPGDTDAYHWTSVAINELGEALIAWIQDNGTKQVYVSGFK